MAEGPPANKIEWVLRSRITEAVTAAMQRSPQYNNKDSHWHYVAQADMWRPELTGDTTITYTRSHHEGAVIVAKNLQLTPKTKVEYSEPVIIPGNPSRTTYKITDLSAGQVWRRKISEKTIDTATLEEQASVGLKLTAEAHFGYKSGTATGGPEGGGSLTAEASANYTRKWGITGQVERAFEEEYVVTGPFNGTVDIVRDISEVTTKMTVSPDFEFTVEVWENSNKLYAWNSYAELILVLEGGAPTDRALSKEFQYDPVNFQFNRISPERIKSFSRSKIKPLDWIIHHDGVGTVQVIENNTLAKEKEELLRKERKRKRKGKNK